MKKRHFRIAVFCCFFLSLLVMSSSFLAAQSLSDIEQLIAGIQQDFGARVILTELPAVPETKIVVAPPGPEDAKDVHAFLLLLKEELGRYPDCFFKEIRLKCVFLVKRQFYENSPTEGLYQIGHDFIMLDFLRNRGNKIKQRHNIHHELYHMLENQAGFSWAGDLWGSMNVPGFQYEYPRPRQRSANPLNYYAPSIPGFVTDYSMKSPDEDRAEIFASLMVENQNRIVHKWIKNDAILKRKVEILKQTLTDFCPEMNPLVSPMGNSE